MAHCSRGERNWGTAYALLGICVMWAFWVCFVIFLASPRSLLNQWPLPMVDQAGFVSSPWLAAANDVGLITLFGLQHSIMARPWFKERVLFAMPDAFVRCTYVHMANLCLFALILFWQPIPIVVWDVGRGIARDALWFLFATGWVILFLGAWSFGILELLGLTQMRAWGHGNAVRQPELKTGRIYRWLRHPMYVGVLLGVWATPRMTVGHLLLAVGFTLYVLIAVRYEERDLLARFGKNYSRWRAA
jgi:uncharacterized membrane protein